MKTLVLALVLVSSSAAAQPVAIDKWTPALPTAGERKAAEVASWVTVVVAVVLDSKASWDNPRRGRAFMLEGTRIATAQLATLGIKRLVHRDRPCAPSCGTDVDYFSFPSGHTATAFSTVGGARLAFTLPLSISTGGLRVAAGKHWLTDTLAGAAIGLATSRIR